MRVVTMTRDGMDRVASMSTQANAEASLASVASARQGRVGGMVSSIEQKDGSALVVTRTPRQHQSTRIPKKAGNIWVVAWKPCPCLLRLIS